MGGVWVGCWVWFSMDEQRFRKELKKVPTQTQQSKTIHLTTKYNKHIAIKHHFIQQAFRKQLVLSYNTQKYDQYTNRVSSLTTLLSLMVVHYLEQANFIALLLMRSLQYLVLIVVFKVLVFSISS